MALRACPTLAHLHRLWPCRCGLRPSPSPSPSPSPNQVRQFEWDHEHTLLDGWNLAFNGSWPLQLSGKVFNNAGPGLEDGDLVEYTSQVTAARGCSLCVMGLQRRALEAAALCLSGCSPMRQGHLVEDHRRPPLPTHNTLGRHACPARWQIVSFKGRVAITKSGTKYYLGTPSPLFEAIRLQLCRATVAAEQGPVKAAAISDAFFPLDPEHPFSFIDLGHSSIVNAPSPTAARAAAHRSRGPPACSGLPSGPEKSAHRRAGADESGCCGALDPARARESHCLRPATQAHGALLVGEAARGCRLVGRVQRGAASPKRRLGSLTAHSSGLLGRTAPGCWLR